MAPDRLNSSARQTQSTVDDARDPPLSRAVLAQAARLDRTLQDLRTQVAEQSKALQEVNSFPSHCVLILVQSRDISARVPNRH